MSEGTCLASSRKEASHSFVAFQVLRSSELLLLVSLNTARTSSAYTLRSQAGSSDPFALGLFPLLTSPSTVQS